MNVFTQSRSGGTTPAAAATSIQRRAQRILAAATRGRAWPVTSSPPTVTPGAAGANSALLGVGAASPNIPGSDARLLPLGGRYSNPGGGGGVVAMQSPGNFAPTAWGAGYSFMTDAEAFEIRVQTQGGFRYRVAIDGEWVQAADHVISGDGSTWRYDLFDFGAGGGRPRRIDVFLQNSYFQGLCVGLSPRAFTGSMTSGSNSVTNIADTSTLTPGALLAGAGIPAGATIAWIVSGTAITISANATATGAGVALTSRATPANNPFTIWSPPADDVAALVWGDSWVYGQGAVNQRDSFVARASEILGLRGVVASGVGAQGYVTTGNDGAALTFRQRIADLTFLGPMDLVVIGPTGMNDTGGTVAALQAEVQLFAAAALAAQPDALFLVFGPQRSPATNTAAARAQAILDGWNAAVAGAGAGARCLVRDTFATPNWFGSSLTAGNFAKYKHSGDDGHLNPAGHAYLGRRVADEVVRFARALAG